MDLEKEQQSVSSLDKYNINNSTDDSNTQDEQCQKVVLKQSGKICKPKRKRRMRLTWVPLIMKNILKSDDEPVFIYNLLRMMKSYEPDQMNKYKYYGIQQAGVGNIESIKLDKTNQCIEIGLNLHSLGSVNFPHLIQLYKSYQNQKYYELALILEEYQEWSNICFQKILQRLISIDIFSASKLIEQEFNNFEIAAKQWANTTYENEMYEMIIGNINIQQRIPQLKKQIYSKNLLLFVGGELQDTYEKMSLYNNFDFLTNFLREDYDDEELEMSRMKVVLKESMKENVEFEFEDKITTFDGYLIPCKVKISSLFYDPESKKISKEPNLFFLLITQYNFDIKWIQFLIEKRSQKNQINRLLPQIQEQNQSSSFDYVCQQEYFLEKFNYTKTLDKLTTH